MRSEILHLFSQSFIETYIYCTYDYLNYIIYLSGLFNNILVISLYAQCVLNDLSEGQTNNNPHITDYMQHLSTTNTA